MLQEREHAEKFRKRLTRTRRRTYSLRVDPISLAQPEAPAVITVRRKRGRPRDPQADTRILGAAADLILARGFDNMTVEEVAAKAKVGKATVYRRWSKKEDLAVAAMERLYNSEMPLPDTGSIRGDLLLAYAGVLAFVNSPRGAAYLKTTIAESVRDPRIAALYRSASDRVEAEAVAMFQRAVDRGEVRSDIDVRWAVRWLSGLIAACSIDGRPLPTEDDVASLVDMILAGVGVPAQHN